MEIGAQLFTVKDFCQDLQSFSETLKRVADIGYKNVQISGVCEYESKWLENELQKNGLKCVLTHIDANKLINETVEVAKVHDVLNCDYVGLGWFPHNPDKENQRTEDFFKIYKPVAQKLKECGKLLMYHNHDQEFKKINGVPVMQLLADSMTEDSMGFTLDTFWVQAGGGDPAQWLEKLSGRVPCIHLKDFAYGRKMSVLGEGNINFERIFEKAELSETKYMLVEQDDCNGENPFDCLKRSYAYLRSCGF